MKKKVFFVQELNLVNYLFFYILSFFIGIKVYNVSSFAKKLNNKWISLIKTRPNMHWEDLPVLRENMTEKWESISANFESWGKDRLFSTGVEIYKAVGEEFKYRLESLMIMEHIAGSFENVIFIDDFSTYYLKKLLKRKRSRFSWLSTLNIYMGVINCFVENFIFASYTFISFLDGIINNRSINREVKYIYDGVASLELSTSENKISFPWLVDGDKIKKNEIFFLLPWPDFQVMDTAFSPEMDRSFLSDYPRYINQYSNYKEIMRAIEETIKQSVFCIFRPTIKNIIKFKIKVQILRYVPFVHSLKPKAYVSTSCTMGYENPIVLYLNALGIHTITWFYGASFISFLNNKKSTFRTPFYCNKLSSQYIFWNNHLRNFFKEHKQYNNEEFIVLGPMMSSNESVMQLDKNALSEIIGFNFNKNYKYISLFDAPPPSDRFIPNPEYLDPINVNKDYNELFIKDVYKLLDDFEDLFIIYKAKRNLTSGVFYYSEELKKIFEEMKNNPRVRILDYRVNPWLAVSAADMCIVMPFGSPAIAALHYGKPAIFHDSKNIAMNHRHQDISELISHNYPELKEKVKSWLFDNKDIASLPRIEQFIGRFPKENSTEKFREHLSALTKD